MFDALSLDQFLVFATVAEEGSFSAAARRLGRAQSVITYAIQKLEDQCETELFDRSGYRPKLTEAGRALLPQAQRVLDGLGEFRRTARNFTEGLEAEIHLSVDPFVPHKPILDALGAFSGRFPDTAARIHTKATSLEAFLAQYHGAIAIVPDLGGPGESYERNFLGNIDLVAIAAPGHPLAAMSGKLSAADLAGHFQIVLAGQHLLPQDHNRGVLGTRRWYVDSLQVKRELILAGLGWGSLPEHAAAADLEAGRLSRLEPARWDGADRMPEIPIALVRRADATGPASNWLFERLSKGAWS